MVALNLSPPPSPSRFRTPSWPKGGKIAPGAAPPPSGTTEPLTQAGPYLLAGGKAAMAATRWRRGANSRAAGGAEGRLAGKGAAGAPAAPAGASRSFAPFRPLAAFTREPGDRVRGREGGGFPPALPAGTQGAPSAPAPLFLPSPPLSQAVRCAGCGEGRREPTGKQRGRPWVQRCRRRSSRPGGSRAL